MNAIEKKLENSKLKENSDDLKGILDDKRECSYCKNQNAVKCLECSNLFCNDRSEGICHIVYHLVKAGHKKISLNSCEIKCVECGESNVFKLGIVNEGCSQDNEINISRMSKNIFCDRCKDAGPLIADRSLKIVSSKPVECSLKDFEKSSKFLKIPLMLDPAIYLKTFIPLIQAECCKEKEIKESMKQENVTLSFSDSYCFFYFRKPNNDLKINIGDEIRFTHKTGLCFRGYVCEEQFSEELKIRIDFNDGFVLPVFHQGLSFTKDNLPKTGYCVEYVWRTICYERMIWALKRLYKDRKKNEIFKYIMKGRKERMKEFEVIQPSGICKLNESQEIAVKAALTRTLTLIQGPPGTGKTMVSAAIIFNLVKKFNKKVLVVAPSNTAVDQLALKINSTGLKVLRVMSKRREETASEIDFLCLHKLLKEFDDKESAKSELIRQADVVCCTCVTSGQKIFNKYVFPFVLIDEAVQATEPLSLIPCVYGATKLILVGDHKQLGPTILNKEVVKYGFKQSLFERLLRIGVMPYLLSIQYRMHPDLCIFPSEYFYNGLLKSGTNPNRVLDFPNNFFYMCNGKEEVSQSGTSFINKSEAVLVENIIRFLFKNGVSEQQIGVITPYEGQRSYILGRIFGNEPGNLEISNVDGFQGREKDFIIVSLVRSNDYQGIGFVADKRRMNVTLTRAKHGLVIIGNAFTLYKNEIWASLLNWYDERNNIFEGPLNALRPCSLKTFNMKSLGNSLG